MQTMAAKLIVTRPKAAGVAFARAVQERCGYSVDTILSPGLDIVPLAARMPDRVDHLVFTSANAVAQLQRLGLSGRPQAWCVGEKTALAARDAGLEAYNGGGDAAQLLATLQEARPAGHIVHLAGKHIRTDIAARLTKDGLTCTQIICYDQKVCAPTPDLTTALTGNMPLVVPLFSARSGLVLTGAEWHAPVHIIAISPHVAGFVEGWEPTTIEVAARPDENSMILATCRILDRLKDGTTVS